MNEYLRKECKLLKALQGISYTELAEFIELSASSFYNWMNNAYNFGEDRQKKLKEIIDLLKE